MNLVTVKPSDLCIVGHDGKIITTSLIVAEVFEKRHDNVLRDIANLGCSPEFSLLNFEESDYTDDRGKTQPCFRMSRDGQSLLTMGFTGPKAMAWKEKYLAAFNAMESTLQTMLADNRRSQPIIDDALGQALQTTQLLLTCRVNEVRERTKEHDVKIDDLGKRVSILEVRSPLSRRDIKRKDKDQHLVVYQAGGCRCPLCRQPCDRIEFDHAYANSLADFAHSWPLCIECHSKLTRGLMTRTEAEPAFHAYQEFAKRVLATMSPQQASLFGP